MLKAPNIPPEVLAIVRDAKALALTAAREGLTLVHGVDDAARPIVLAVFATAMDLLERALRAHRAIVTAPALSVVLRDHDEDPGAAPDERPL